MLLGRSCWFLPRALEAIDPPHYNLPHWRTFERKLAYRLQKVTETGRWKLSIIFGWSSTSWTQRIMHIDNDEDFEILDQRVPKHLGEERWYACVGGVEAGCLKEALWMFDT